ncbi:MAG: glycoside hydrolase family 3 C-terminal domain-containing protein [Bacteroidales bacterium]|nr:glycoside hydrolase family 3 C-terminal domain-containing protein [Bacteroidales bacterium]
MKRIFAVIAIAAGLFAASCTPKSQMEKDLDKIMSKMTLDQKIGQMIQIEISKITYKNPEFDFYNIIKLSEEDLAKLIAKYGMQDQYNAAAMLAARDIQDWNSLLPFYTLSIQLDKIEGFSLDRDKMKVVFGDLHVGSILNMLGNAEASPLPLWQKSIAEMEAASIEFNGIPMIYGLDQVHGPSYIAGGTMLPQQIGMAATFNAPLVAELGEMNAYETRAGGVRWCFGPSMDLSVEPSWSRCYETWGEDPYLTSIMAGAYARGLFGPDNNHIDAYHVIPCLKHYMGYGAPHNGIDRTNAVISEPDLREKHFEPFRRAALDGIPSVMSNSAAVNGEPGVCNTMLLTDWLKKECKWDGVIVTDWSDVNELHRLFHCATDVKNAIELSINAGIDMIMVPYELTYNAMLKELVEEGKVPMSRINDACRRVLRMKYRAGLFDEEQPQAEYPLFGSPEFAAKALQAAVESEVLLKNQDNILPLKPGAKILLCGPNANTMRGLSGGWTLTWQGSKAEHLSDPYNTILEAFVNRFGKNNVIFEPGVEYDLQASDWQTEKKPQIQKAVAKAANADVIVVCVGESSYAETQGSIKDANLSANQKELVKALAKTGKPIVLILNEGRPRLISDIEPLARAVVDILLPSHYGGDALAALLSGDENFSGRLPFTYPAYPNAFTTYSFKVMEDRSTTPGIYNYENHASVQWWFGEGLSYTSFAYSSFAADKEKFGAKDVLNFSIDVTNTGERDGKEVVMIYSSDDFASLMPDNRRLRAFTKVDLKAGETKKVSLQIPAEDLSFVGTDGKYHLEEGSFTFMCGGQYLKADCIETRIR